MAEKEPGEIKEAREVREKAEAEAAEAAKRAAEPAPESERKVTLEAVMDRLDELCKRFDYFAELVLDAEAIELEELEEKPAVEKPVTVEETRKVEVKPEPKPEPKREPATPAEEKRERRHQLI